MLSIDETIAHARDVAKRNREQWKNCHADRRDIEHQTCEQCAEEHEQLAEWLEDYKRIKMLIPIEQALKNEYNKAIDDLLGGMNQITYNCQDADELFEKICDLAEQLKAGGVNGK